MLNLLRARLRQGHRTIAFPADQPVLPDRFRGRPLLDSSKCRDGCAACIAACPVDAIAKTGDRLQLDLGRCLFCVEFAEACPEIADRAIERFRRQELCMLGTLREEIGRASCRERV